MAEGYVVKMMAYQGADGRLVRNLSEAQLIKDHQLAESAAEVSGGWVVPVIRPEKSKKKVKPVKNNQAWMRRDC